MSDYVFGNRYGVLTVNEREKIDEPQMIKFINSDYDVLFRIPDEGYIQIKYPDGKIYAYQCSHLDDYHTLIGNRAFHICEFAENMEQIGATYTESPDRHVIWSDRDLDLDDWRDDLLEEEPDLDEEQLYERMYEVNAEYLGDERMNLGVPVDGTILVIADLGLWDGHRQAYKEIHDGNLSDCLEYLHDSAEWYVTRDGEFCSKQVHHDGTNRYVYRKIKDGVTEDMIADLEDKIYDNIATQNDIDKVTEKLGGEVAKVYGWELPDKVIDLRQKTKEKGGDAR